MKTIIVIGGSKGIENAILKKLLKYSKVINISRTTPKFNNANLIPFSSYITKDELPEIKVADAHIYHPGSINLKSISKLSINDFKIKVLSDIKAIQKYLSILKDSKHLAILLFSTIAIQLGMTFMHN